jgi:hypothetical protein
MHQDRCFTQDSNYDRLWGQTEKYHFSRAWTGFRGGSNWKVGVRTKNKPIETEPNNLKVLGATYVTKPLECHKTTDSEAFLSYELRYRMLHY